MYRSPLSRLCVLYVETLTGVLFWSFDLLGNIFEQLVFYLRPSPDLAFCEFSFGPVIIITDPLGFRDPPSHDARRYPGKDDDVFRFDTYRDDDAILRWDARRLNLDGRGERPAGRAQLLAKKGASGRMQRPAEPVPIPWSGVKASDGFGKLRKVAAFWKNPEKNW